MTIAHLTEVNPTFTAPEDLVIQAVEISLVDSTLPDGPTAFACLTPQGALSGVRDGFRFILNGFRPAAERGFWTGLDLALARGEELSLTWTLGGIGYIDANIFYVGRRDPSHVSKSNV